MLLDISSNLVLLQSRLYSPGYAGPGRWVIFRPQDRRGFSAIGADVVPDVVRILAQACGGADEDGIRSTTPHVTDNQFESLKAAGLLAEADWSVDDPGTFISVYQRATYDYPFQDYLDENWKAKEESLLKHYDSLWPPPPSTITREGEFLALPEAVFENLEARDDVSNLDWIAAVLRYTFGPTGEIHTSRLVCQRRTSPSGGARHPSEGALFLPKALEGVPAGLYLYDSGRHGLVKAEADRYPDFSLPDSVEFAVLVRSRVERAMWRYRELRAWRPVLLDAGHIVETLSILLQRRRLSAHVLTPPPASQSNLSWLEEPDIALVAASRSQESPEFRWSFPLADSSMISADDYLTNPAAYLTFRPDGLRGHVVWPHTGVTDLDFVDFRIISHCLPSSRGDRVTSLEGICDAVDETDPPRILRLVRSGLLLDRHQAAKLYDAARLWSRYSWYLSMLAHLGAAHDSEGTAAAGRIRTEPVVVSLSSLLTRRTTRHFSQTPVARETIDSIIGRALVGVDPDRFKIFVGYVNVDGAESGLHPWLWNESQPGPWLRDLSGSDLRAMAAGQAFIETATAAIILTTDTHGCDSRSYEMSILELGRIGQRICLIAEELRLGVFLTPALNDRETLSSIGLPDRFDTIGYLFGLGIK